MWLRLGNDGRMAHVTALHRSWGCSVQSPAVQSHADPSCFQCSTLPTQHWRLHPAGPHCRLHAAGSTLQVPHCRLHTAPHYRSTLQVPHCRLHTASHYRSTLQVPHCTLHTTVVTQRVSLMLSIQLPGSVTGPHLSSCSLRSAFRRVGTARHTCLAPAEAFGCSGRLLRELIIRVEIGTLCGHVLIVPQKAEPLNTPESAI